MLRRRNRLVAQSLCILWITLVPMATCQNKVARIVNNGTDVLTNIGHTISLNCEVENTENRPVQWWFVDHDLQISNNNDILTSTSYPNHYEIIRPEGGEYVHWNLKITSIQSSDAGHYRCQINGSAAAIISTVTIENDPNAAQRPTVLPAVDFTDCCRSLNVSATCLPVCNPRTMDLNNFDPRNCMTDLLKLLQCGGDGRNHAPCCRRAHLPIPCLDFCVNKPPSSLTDDLNVCLNRAIDIISCFEEGNHLLPSAPERVLVNPLTSHSLHVKWQRPSENARNLTGYRVFYRESDKTTYKSTDVTTDMQYTIDNLSPITLYDVYVTAVNVHGSSLPSYTVQASTLGSIQLGPTTQEGFPACCLRQGVSQKCQTALCSGTSMQATGGMGVSECLSELDKVFHCMAGERNHTNCCIMSGVPSRCFPVCAGSPSQANYSTIDCFTQQMPKIISCYEEGQDILPGPPSDLVLVEVSDMHVNVSWEPPASHPEKVQNYIVSYGMVDGPQIQVPSQDLRITLEDLYPSTLYKVKVAAVNDRGSSLPTPEIIFLTYYDDGEVAPSTAPIPQNQGPPPSLEECCNDENVKEKCRPMCSYNVSFSEFEPETLLECEPDLGKVFMCGAGGSNHTRCCQQRGVVQQCLPFCSFDRRTLEVFTFDYAHISCVYMGAAIQQCMSEGIVTHPSSPELLSIRNYTAHTISLSWQPPKRTGVNNITEYVVRYRKVFQEQLWHEVSVPSAYHAYILQNLDSGQVYEAQVMAVSVDRRSLPGETFEVTTLPLSVPTPVLLPNLNFTAPSNITGCCMEEGVKPECMAGCDGSSVVKIEEVCATDLDKILRCSADNRDHRPCCQNNKVPEECLGFCLGNGKIEHFVSMLCLSFSQEILTCFHEGYEQLPSSPVSVAVREIGSSYVVVTWDKPEHGGDELLFDLFYRSVGQMTFEKIDNVKPKYNLTGLDPFTTYELFIVAENQHGTSRPSPTIEVWTLERTGPEIHVWQVPEGNIQENMGVVLSCITESAANVYIYWIIPSGKEVHDSLLDIRHVNSTHTGRYVCMASGPGGQRSSKDLYLHVMYGPEAMAVEKEVSVSPERGLSAELKCTFSGFPRHVTWLKNGNEITPAFPGWYRFEHSLTTNEVTGVMEATLKIENVRREDLGVYSCRGTNKLGRHQAHIKLVNPYPTPTLPGFEPAPKQINVSACCIQRGVKPICSPACTFDVDISILTSLPNPLVCVDDLTHLIQCAADGRNHTKCCQSRQVPPECYSFCAGVVPDQLDDGHLQCIQEVEKIVQCMEEGAEYVPSPPRNVKAQLTNEGHIRVWWDPPAVNADMVQQYYVIYKGPSGQEEEHMEVPQYKQEIILSGIHSNTQYEVYLEARNHHGSSQTSNHVYITTIQFTPSAPMNLQGTILAYVNVRLDWDRPLRHPGAITDYIVYYRPQGQSEWTTVSTKYIETTYEIDQLKPKTTYEMKVAAKSSTHRSRESNVIVIKTGVTKISTRPQPQTGDKHLGVVLGIVFTIFILIVTTGVIAFWYIRVRKNNGSGYKESVSFENPGYTTAAEARVLGLPNYDPKHRGREASGPVSNPENKESAIMRESDAHSDQGYSTLSPSADLTPASTPTSHTATLDVTQLNPHENIQADLEEVAAKL